jgi:hypothetical protein
MRKFLKSIFIILLLLVTIVIVFTLAFTKDYTSITLKRSIEVNAPKQKVFDYIVHTENKDKWLGNPDEEITRSSKGKDATVGFIRSWEIQSPPEKGSETITKIEVDKSIETQVTNNVNGEKTNSKQILSCVPVDNNKTTLTWKMESNVHLKFLPRMLLGFSQMIMKSDDYQNAYEEGIQSEMENNGVYKSLDESLQKLKANIEE